MRYIYTKNDVFDTETGIRYQLTLCYTGKLNHNIGVYLYSLHKADESSYFRYEGEDAISFWRQLAGIVVMNGEFAIFKKWMVEDLVTLERSIKDNE